MLRHHFHRLFLLVTLALLATAANAQSNSGTISGAITDPSGAIVPNASVQISNHVSGYTRSFTTDSSGQFHFYNVPFDHYQLTVTMTGFAATSKSVDVHSVVPITLPIQLAIADASTTVNVEGGADVIETDPSFHTDVDRALIDRMPIESQSSSLSSIVTLSSPGVTADSNGLFHGLGDHAENSFSVDGQPITDQQSKVFSNQLPADAV